MIEMLCRNRVRDFATWKKVFDAQTEAHEEAGLTLKALWQEVNTPGNVFFLFAVESIDRAERFVADPVSEEAGREAGVIDGEYYFVHRLEGA
jgi:hypothetical protein